MYPKLRIICGTGRCGTFSMYRIFQAQPNVFARHEGLPFPWEFEPAPLYYYTQRILINEWSGQRFWVSSSYSWVKYLGLAFKHFKDVKAVCLVRPRAEIIASFLKRWPDENYWTSEESSHFDGQYPEFNATGPNPAGLAETWPKYDLPKEQAIGAYWDEYYQTCKMWQRKLPDAMMVISMHDALNTACGQKRIFDFFGLPESDQLLRINVRTNAHDNPYGYLYREIKGGDVRSTDYILEGTSLG